MVVGKRQERLDSLEGAESPPVYRGDHDPSTAEIPF